MITSYQKYALEHNSPIDILVLRTNAVRYLHLL